ncbi:MAG: hypothetical protein DRH50_09620 [Deltaproteobacteria bacterium]|nr:MAG: hypothetical protein DRH50_09620 [Deltaproteobacteria bacterium]
MKILKYRVRFLTPAFLGDADQSGQWRTPPFKALLRQWWRMVYAAEKNFNVTIGEMRREEGMLFGNAWLSHERGGKKVQDHCQSLVQLRLSEWQSGGLDSWDGLEKTGKIHHPEVQHTHYKVGPQAYLGYGPLDGRGGTRLTRKRAIEPGEEAILSLRVPGKHAEVLKNTLTLMNFYGAVGGRCRNGWGAFTLTPVGEGTPQHPANLTRFFRLWRKALELTWPHALGLGDDGRPLVWTTRPHENWRSLMQELAVIKVGVRTQFVFFSGNSDSPEMRHWLAYPVTKHTVYPWNNNTSGRLPNTLRFTARPANGGHLQGVIFHFPCKPPDEFSPDLKTLEKVWGQVHQLLDELARPRGERRYAMIADADRRAKLKPHLDEITIHRRKGGCP